MLGEGVWLHSERRRLVRVCAAVTGDCARARASEGEMISSLQQVFGSYTESPVF